MSSTQNLIIVPGHAAFRASVQQAPDNPADQTAWVLQSFQTGEVPHYIEHIRRGLELLRQDPQALLLFSGGITRREAGTWSEASTYAACAERYNYWLSPDDPRIADCKARIGLEEHARDSFENMQFSLYRYGELIGGAPRHVTIVGWKFKQPRFDAHRQTLGIPTTDCSYIGCGNPDDLAGALAGEARTLEQFRIDPYGKTGPLQAKKLQRNPFNKTIPYTEVQNSDADNQ